MTMSSSFYKDQKMSRTLMIGKLIGSAIEQV